jgi:hypothetical protein
MQNHQPGSANRAQGVSARSFFSKFSVKEFFRSLVSMRFSRGGAARMLTHGGSATNSVQALSLSADKWLY